MGDLTEVLREFVEDPPSDPWSHLQWGRPPFVRDQLGAATDLSFQHRVARFRYVSPQHFWREFAEESSPLLPVISGIDDPEVRDALRRAAVEALDEWFVDNAVRVEFLLVRGVVE